MLLADTFLVTVITAVIAWAEDNCCGQANKISFLLFLFIDITLLFCVSTIGLRKELSKERGNEAIWEKSYFLGRQIRKIMGTQSHRTAKVIREV